jgi:hypothetical protein
VAAASAALVSRSPDANAKLTRRALRDPEREQKPRRRPYTDDGSTGRDRQDRRRGAHAEDGHRERRREPNAERAQQEGASQGARRPAAQEQETGDERRPREASGVCSPPVDGVQAIGAPDDREPCHPLSKHEYRQTADAEEDHDHQRGAEDRPRRREGGGGEQSIATASTMPRATKEMAIDSSPTLTPPSRRRVEIFDDVVQPERQDDSAAAVAPRRETPRAVGALVRDAAKRVSSPMSSRATPRSCRVRSRSRSSASPAPAHPFLPLTTTLTRLR